MEKEDLGAKATAITALLILGLGLAALFTGQSWFWMVFAIGFAVVLPIIAILTGGPDDDDQTTTTRSDRDEETESKTDALGILRDRYARGELSEAQFEAKLDRLLESETLEDVQDRREAEREKAFERR